MPVRNLLLVLVSLLPLNWPTSTLAAVDKVLILAAASTREALKDAVPDGVRIAHAGSGALARQIINGAPAGIFLTAHAKWLKAVEQAGIPLPRQCPVAGNRLVVVAPLAQHPTWSTDSDPLASFTGERIAVGEVASVPAGIYARSALETLGLWPKLAPKLAQTANVRAALALAERGAVDLAIVYQSDAAASERVRVVSHLPTDSHPPIRYVAAAISEDAAAMKVLDRLCSDAVRAIFVAHGFAPL